MIEAECMNGNGDGSENSPSEILHPADKWAIACGAMQRKFHGGVFNGNGCNKLLSDPGLHLLQQFLPPVLFDYLHCFRMFAQVKMACFGTTLSPNTFECITKFKQAFLNLEINVTPTVHIVFAHISDFVKYNQENELGNHGLGVWSDQCFETMHQESDTVKTVNQYSESFPQRSLRALCFFNSTHI